MKGGKEGSEGEKREQGGAGRNVGKMGETTYEYDGSGEEGRAKKKKAGHGASASYARRKRILRLRTSQGRKEPRQKSRHSPYKDGRTADRAAEDARQPTTRALRPNSGGAQGLGPRAQGDEEGRWV